MSTIISGDTGITFPDDSTQSKAVSQVTPFAVTASAIAGAELQLPEATANGVNYVAVKAPNTLAANTTFTLPAADGTNGQFLQTNGSGALGFASVSPAGTTGQVQINSAGAFGAVAEGTAGQVLTSGGVGVAPSFATLSTAVQYPQNIQSANYTLVLADAGKMIFHPVADTTVRTYTIPANASVAFPIGTVVLFTVENGGTAVNVAINSDTLLLGDGMTAPIKVSENNTLMAIKVTSTKWMANYLWDGTSDTFVAFATNSAPGVVAFPWTPNGFGPQYPPLSASTYATGAAYGVSFNPNGENVAVAHTSTPFVSVFKFSPLGLGDRFANPATLPGALGRCVKFSNKGDAVLVGNDTGSFIYAYPWTSSGFGTKFADPGTLPTGRITGISFTPSDNAVALSTFVSPYALVYAWSGSGFGTKFADPGSPVPEATNSVAFSPAGTEVIFTSNTFTYSGIFAYRWSGSGFGTQFSSPATVPPAGQSIPSVAFNPSGDTVAICANGTPFIYTYPWSSSGFGAKYANPSTPPSNGANGVAFTPDGRNIIVATDSGPVAYPWSAGFGTRYALPTGFGSVNGVSVGSFS